MPEFLEVSSGSTRRSFKRDYLSLLKKFDVAYDPRYLFEYAEVEKPSHGGRVIARNRIL